MFVCSTYCRSAYNHAVASYLVSDLDGKRRPGFRPSYLGRRTASFARASSLAEQKFAGGQNVMIPHQPKVKQRLAMRGYGTFYKMVLLKISVISVAYSSL